MIIFRQSVPPRNYGRCSMLKRKINAWIKSWLPVQNRLWKRIDARNAVLAFQRGLLSENICWHTSQLRENVRCRCVTKLVIQRNSFECICDHMPVRTPTAFRSASFAGKHLTSSSILRITLCTMWENSRQLEIFTWYSNFLLVNVVSMWLFGRCKLFHLFFSWFKSSYKYMKLNCNEMW